MEDRKEFMSVFLLFPLNTHLLLLQLSLKEDDDVTPVTLLHNMVGHLYGPSRPLGAVMCGYSGIRTFEPQVMCLVGLICLAVVHQFMGWRYYKF